jgi:tetratricopeptide (TPR) repeat protein
MTYGALKSAHLVASGDYDAALAAANGELAMQPNEPEVFFYRAQALAGLGRWEEAIADYEAALRLDASDSALDPASVDDELFFALRTLATARKGDPAAALATLERYRAALPEGRHVADLATWADHINGVEQVWVRERA